MNRRTSPGAATVARRSEPPAWRLGVGACLAVALGAAIITALSAASWTGTGAATAIPAAIAEFGRSAAPAMAWLLMAFGFGWPVRRLLAPRGSETERSSAVVQVAGGVAVALALDALFGTLGLLGTRTAWLLVTAGGALAATSLWRDRPRCHPLSPLALAAGPAVVILLLASASAPGWLWASEFGGYDALSYHLQLPKEWLLAGRIEPTPHCVYGKFPSFVEAAFLHVMALRGADADAALDSAVSCQMLHAGLALLAAWICGEAAASWSSHRATPTLADIASTRSIAAAVAAAVVVTTPWVVVVGSLAYNEMATLLMLAAAMVLLGPTARRELGIADATRRGAAVGLLATAAVGAKLTATGFVALPLALLLLWSLPPRRWLVACAAGALVALALLAPWLVRNAMATGNPLFPFASATFGLGVGEFAWSVDQVERFARGHASDLSLPARLVRLAQQFPLYGYGPNPLSGEPWRAQWSVVPLLGALALLWLAGARRSRAVAARLAAVLGVQMAFWLAATHLQSRFLLPAVVPLAMACGLAVASLLEASRGRSGADADSSAPSPTHAARFGMLIVVLALGALAFVPVAIYRTEREGMPSAAIGAASFMQGQSSTTEDSAVIADVPAHWMNAALPEGSRVLLVGEARPFWFRGEPASYAWQSTWDRGALSALLRDHPGDVAAQRRALRAAGFTHLLIDPAMLDRWDRSGWNDPLLTSAALLPMLDPPNRVLKRFAGGTVLVEVGP